MKKLLPLIAMFSVLVSAADITGTWKGTADTPMGTVERTFVFKVDGNKLTGETSSNLSGKSTITDGKIDGDNISFSITVKIQDQELKLDYTGKVIGKEIKLHSDAAGNSIDYVVKKIS